MAEEMSEQQAESMIRDLMDQKSNKHTFLTKVIQEDDTTKVGNLTKEELGNPQLELRGIKELELFANNIYNDKEWGDFFKELSEIQTSTSLSKDALLIKLAATDKKEMADLTEVERKENKGWFRKK